MEREDIVRDDFQTVRKGWDPEAVRAHLEALAARLPGSTSLAEGAGERVAGIIAAAESAAAEIEAEARREAERALGEAREQAEQIVTAARAEAQGGVERAQAAVETLVGQAEELRSQVGSLGESLAGDVRERLGGAGPAGVQEHEPEPEPPTPEPPGPEPPKPEPPRPESQPEPTEPEPQPEPTEPEPTEPEPMPEPPQPEPPVPERGPEPTVPTPEAAPAAGTEELLAQLKAGMGAADRPEEPADAGGWTADATAQGATKADPAARLVAMNLALEGADREAITAGLVSEFGQIEGIDELLDDVLSRAGR